MTDQAIAINALNQVASISLTISNRTSESSAASINRLIEVLDTQELAGAIESMEKRQA